MAYSAAKKDDPDEEHHESHGKKTHKCCCCRMTKGRICKIVLLATLGPILLLALIIGIYILVVRLSYNPPPSQFSSANDTNAFILELLTEEDFADTNGTSSTDTSNATYVSPRASSRDAFTFQTNINPPWTDCSGGQSLATVRVVSIGSCELDNDNRCIFPMEVDWILEVAFTMKASEQLYQSPAFHACGKAVYLGTPCRTQPFKYPNPCNSSNLECPLHGGKSYLYRNVGGIHQRDLPVKVMFDTVVDTYLRLKSSDAPNAPLIFCIRIPAMVKIV